MAEETPQAPDELRSEINRITGKIVTCVYPVSNTPGSGFLEKIYGNALAFELRQNGLKTEQQYPIKVFYGNELVGDFAADLLVDDRVVVELKATRVLDDAHSAQCLNYLKATGIPVCLLVNFGRPRVEIKRLILDR